MAVSGGKFPRFRFNTGGAPGVHWMSEIMSDGSHPTEAQKNWFARLLGPQVWQELCREPEFHEALDRSLGAARRLALRHLADKERARSAH